MRTTVNMALSVWDGLDDSYSHGQLAANWDAVDQHDHTPGKGKPLPTAALQDHSVTNAKLAPDSVTTVEIKNGTILAEDLAPGIIGVQQLDPALFGHLFPLGIVTAWFRPDAAIPIPNGFVLCDGRQVTDHSYSGLTTITVPNLVNKFILGAGLTGTGTTPDKPPAENAAGGAHNRAWNHSHTVDAHAHTVQSHSHVISPDGGHSHQLQDANGTYTIRERQVYAPQNTELTAGQMPGGWANQGKPVRALYAYAAFDRAYADYGGVAMPITTQPAHAHGGATQPAGTATDPTPLTTNGQSTGGDIRPAYYGLLYIVKVKHPS